MKQKLKDGLRLFGTKARGMLANNVGIKLLSVVIALFLWSYVISSNPSITRDKIVTGLDIAVTGQSVLSSRGLAVLTDLNSLLSAARVQVSVSQSNYSLVTQDNVSVEMDLSGIRKTGTQSVKLRGYSSYGTVAQVWPDTVEIEIEEQDQRYVPVNVQLTGERLDGYWYNVSRTNPTQVSVSGPTSIVRTVSSAQVYLDVTGRTESFSQAEQFVLLDSQGVEITSSTLSKPTSSITVGVDIYPTKQIGVSEDIGETLKGQLPAGYVVTNVDVSPDVITVAADQSLLDSLDELMIEPVSVTSSTRTFTAIASIVKLKDVKNISSEQVNVTVTIEEQNQTKTFSSLQAVLLNVGENDVVTWDSPKFTVRVTGAYSVVKNLSRADLLLTVDLEGVGPGAHDIPVVASVDNYPELECVVTPSVATITIEDTSPKG